jgi:hypothetical protein
LAAQKRGWQTCPAPSVSAEQIERLVIDQLQGLENAPANLGSIFEALEPRRKAASCGSSSSTLITRAARAP